MFAWLGGVGFALQPCAQVPVVGQGGRGRQQYLQRCSPRGCSGSSAGRSGSAPAPAPASLPSAGTLSGTSCTHKGMLREALLGRVLPKGGVERGHLSSPHLCIHTLQSGCKGIHGAVQGMCCQTGSDPPRAGWHQDGLPIPRKKFAPTCSGSVWDGIPGRAALHPGEAGCGPSC